MDALNDILSTATLHVAVALEDGRVALRFGYVLDGQFTPDPRLHEVTCSPGEALVLSLTLSGTAWEALGARASEGDE